MFPSILTVSEAWRASAYSIPRPVPATERPAPPAVANENKPPRRARRTLIAASALSLFAVLVIAGWLTS